MKIQEVIDELERIKKKYGAEVEVVVCSRECGCDTYSNLWFEIENIDNETICTL